MLQKTATRRRKKARIHLMNTGLFLLKQQNYANYANLAIALRRDITPNKPKPANIKA